MESELIDACALCDVIGIFITLTLQLFFIAIGAIHTTAAATAVTPFVVVLYKRFKRL
jgi:hypothetical protein